DRIDTFDGPVERAFAPQSVTLKLADEVDVSRGDMICHPHEPPAVVRQLDARMVWLNERALDGRRAYLIKHTTRMVPARLERVAARLNLETLKWEDAETLFLNDVGRVSFQCMRPLCVDPYARVRGTGAFIVIDAVT